MFSLLKPMLFPLLIEIGNIRNVNGYKQKACTKKMKFENVKKKDLQISLCYIAVDAKF